MHAYHGQNDLVCGHLGDSVKERGKNEADKTSVAKMTPYQLAQPTTLLWYTAHMLILDLKKVTRTSSTTKLKNITFMKKAKQH